MFSPPRVVRLQHGTVTGTSFWEVVAVMDPRGLAARLLIKAAVLAVGVMNLEQEYILNLCLQPLPTLEPEVHVPV